MGDVSRSGSGAVSLRAFRLTSAFVAAHKEGKFTVERYPKSPLQLTLSLSRHNLTHRDILEELPLEVHNSNLTTSLLQALDSPLTNTVPLSPNFDALDLNLDPYLEKNIEYLLDGLDEYSYEQGNLQYFARQLAREQSKIAAWQAKRVPPVQTTPP
jgi:translation initiation factor 3 subunit H